MVFHVLDISVIGSNFKKIIKKQHARDLIIYSLAILTFLSCSADASASNSTGSGRNYPFDSLVIPDSDAGKVIYVDSINKESLLWREFTSSDVNASSCHRFMPSDVFIDNSGKIYISSAGKDVSGLFSVSDTGNSIKKMFVDGDRVDAFTIDIAEGILYFTLNDREEKSLRNHLIFHLLLL